MTVTATGAFVLPKMIAGAWKFRREGDFGVSVAELCVTAQKLVNANPGGGVFHDVFIRGTGKDEIGICFAYEPSDKEWDRSGTHPKLKFDLYIDFFRRHHGASFKGYDIGHTVTKLTLENLA